MRTFRQSGFTLIEAIIALAILAIAAAVAMPEFSKLVANRRVASAADDLHVTLFYARSEAIRLNQPVVVQPIDGDWSNGWEMPDPAHAGTFLAQHAQTGLKVSENNGAVAVTYLPTGRLSGGAVPAFSLCDTQKRSKQRIVTVELSGLPGITLAGTCP